MSMVRAASGNQKKPESAERVRIAMARAGGMREVLGVGVEAQSARQANQEAAMRAIQRRSGSERARVTGRMASNRRSAVRRRRGSAKRRGRVSQKEARAHRRSDSARDGEWAWRVARGASARVRRRSARVLRMIAWEPARRAERREAMRGARVMKREGREATRSSRWREARSMRVLGEERSAPHSGQMEAWMGYAQRAQAGWAERADMGADIGRPRTGVEVRRSTSQRAFGGREEDDDAEGFGDVVEAVRDGAADVEDVALRDGAGLIARCEPGAALENDVDLVLGVRGLRVGGAGLEDIEACGDRGGA